MTSRVARLGRLFNNGGPTSAAMVLRAADLGKVAGGMRTDGSIGSEWLFWGKLGSKREDGSRITHPLLCHMIDVAAVAQAMWQEVLSPAATRRLAGRLGLDPDAAGRWIAFWAGLHDLGKASPAFQSQYEPLYRRLVEAGLPCPAHPPETAHGLLSAYALPDVLTGFGLPRALAKQIATIIGGHHGILPAPGKVEEVHRHSIGRGRWEQARQRLAEILAEALSVPSAIEVGAVDNPSAMAIAGLVAVADWIGSDERYFPYQMDEAASQHYLNVPQYLEQARASAARALADLHWVPAEPTPADLPFEHLFHLLQPNATQRAVIAVASSLDVPCLVIIESPMGQGKTEAAMYLADRWGMAGQRGYYFALPTQATSNQMFSRVRGFLCRRYPGQIVNLQLLHGHAALSAELQVLRQHEGRLLEPRAVYDDVRGAARLGDTTNVIAAEWFTHRKRGLLAPFGVGTIDQSLLAALQTKHVFVRLFGLANKVVIVDEVHAYDTYMTALLERLLEWLAALGTSVVLLSATLPVARRARLTGAYRRGLGITADTPAPAVPYPRVTWATAVGVDARGIARPEGSGRWALALRWVDGALPSDEAAFQLGRQLQEALSHGGCAAVICNTVRRAQEVYRALQRYFPGDADDGWPVLDLLHAQYLFEQREAREQRAMVRFGKPGGQVEVRELGRVPVRRPNRAVLVATQVIEQSLDLDFDLMVSELAPADLLLQRSGRLHRHERERPATLLSPTLWICRPERFVEGVPQFGRANELVYDPHILLRSWLALKDRASITIPDEVEGVIEAVYDERPCPPDLSAPLRRRWDETRQQQAEREQDDQQEASSRWLKPPSYEGQLAEICSQPKEEDAPDFHQAHQALTRLAEPTVQVVCLYDHGGRPALDREGQETVNPSTRPDVALAQRLLRRSVTLSDRRVVFTLMEQPVPSGWRESSLLRHHRLILLDQHGQAECGGYRLVVDPALGVRIAETKGVP
jgi:CRISPR-associated endonuclease/helicase Cas3